MTKKEQKKRSINGRGFKEMARKEPLGLLISEADHIKGRLLSYLPMGENEAKTILDESSEIAELNKGDHFYNTSRPYIISMYENQNDIYVGLRCPNYPGGNNLFGLTSGIQTQVTNKMGNMALPINSISEDKKGRILASGIERIVDINGNPVLEENLKIIGSDNVQDMLTQREEWYLNVVDALDGGKNFLCTYNPKDTSCTPVEEGQSLPDKVGSMRLGNSNEDLIYTNGEYLARNGKMMYGTQLRTKTLDLSSPFSEGETLRDKEYSELEVISRNEDHVTIVAAGRGVSDEGKYDPHNTNFPITKYDVEGIDAYNSEPIYQPSREHVCSIARVDYKQNHEWLLEQADRMSKEKR